MFLHKQGLNELYDKLREFTHKIQQGRSGYYFNVPESEILRVRNEMVGPALAKLKKLVPTIRKEEHVIDGLWRMILNNFLKSDAHINDLRSWAYIRQWIDQLEEEIITTTPLMQKYFERMMYTGDMRLPYGIMELRDLLPHLKRILELSEGIGKYFKIYQERLEEVSILFNKQEDRLQEFERDALSWL